MAITEIRLNGPTPMFDGEFCKNCKDRSIEPVNCHSICDMYLSLKKEREELYLKRREASEIEEPFADRKLKAKWRNIKNE